MNLGELHQFWFEEISLTNEYYSRKVPQWFFSQNSSFDEQCQERFSPWLYSLAIIETRLKELSNEDYVSLILLLDQIPRNSFRGTPDAFRFDFFARELSLRALDTEREKELSLPEKMFLYIPLEHAEDLNLQKLSVEKFNCLHEEAPDEIRQWTELALKKALEHRETIEQFGCFPKRARSVC